MRFYVVQNASEHIIDTFLSPEAAMGVLKAEDWQRNEHNFWKSEQLGLTIRCFEAKG